MQRDEAETRFIVLLVSDILKSPPLPDFDYLSEPESNSAADANNDSKTDSTSKSETPLAGVIELTDGWYFIEAILDASLTILLQTHQIYPGLKLRIACSHMRNNENGCAPLEITTNQPRRPCSAFFASFSEEVPIRYYNTDGLSTPQFMLQYNGTRRAAWNSYLGFTTTHVFNTNINDCISNGGMIPQTDVLITRKYGVRYQESIDEKKIYRNQSEEDEEQKRWELRRERVTSEVIAHHDVPELEGVDESQELSHTQQMMEEKHRTKVMEEQQHELEEKINEALEKEGIKERSVQMIGYLKVISPYRFKENKQFDVSCLSLMADPHANPVIGAHHHLYTSINVTLWDTSPAVMDSLSEGSIYRVTMLQTPPNKFHTFDSLSVYTSNTTHWEDVTAEYRKLRDKAATGEMDDPRGLYSENVFDHWEPRRISSLSTDDFATNNDYDLLLFFLHCSEKKEREFDSASCYYDVTCCDLSGHIAVISVNEGLFVPFSRCLCS